MLKLTFIPDGALPKDGIVLCNTTRSLAELNVEFNHQRVISVEQIATALGGGAAAFAQDFSNQRNVLSLRVRRSVDFTAPNPVAFADPEAAFLFTLDQPAYFPSTGILQIDILGATTGASQRWMLNTAVKGIRNKFEDLGIAPAFDYQFDGGLITPNSPF
ncbi:MAG TPA: hypothetical protein VK815_07925 [Candidatus Acidoferrales bacterium]|jgi:hypothetical protein|nr:hypothetical protein [Candidatus Acidoferrales bacterium]